MELDFATLKDLRLGHPAWKLLRADLAPLIISFLHRTYVLPNLRTLPLSELGEKLEDDPVTGLQGALSIMVAEPR